MPNWLKQMQSGPDVIPALAFSRWSCGCQDADGILYPLLHSSSGWSSVKNPEIDAALDLARKSLSEDERLAPTRRFMRWLTRTTISSRSTRQLSSMARPNRSSSLRPPMKASSSTASRGRTDAMRRGRPARGCLRMLTNHEFSNADVIRSRTPIRHAGRRCIALIHTGQMFGDMPDTFWIVILEVLMAWRARSVVDERLEFCRLADLENTNISALCERFGISRQTG